jgi:hypothetical protein
MRSGVLELSPFEKKGELRAARDLPFRFFSLGGDLMAFGDWPEAFAAWLEL